MYEAVYNCVGLFGNKHFHLWIQSNNDGFPELALSLIMVVNIGVIRIVQGTWDNTDAVYRKDVNNEGEKYVWISVDHRQKQSGQLTLMCLDYGLGMVSSLH